MDTGQRPVVGCCAREKPSVSPRPLFLMKDATPISAGSAAALSARITATLGPLDADEQACCEKLEELGAKIAELQGEIKDAEDNLRIIKSAKVEAVRSLMNEDPLLAEAFSGDKASSVTAEAVADAVAVADEPVEAAEIVEDDDSDEDVVEASDESEDDGNPLLRMDD